MLEALAKRSSITRGRRVHAGPPSLLQESADRFLSDGDTNREEISAGTAPLRHPLRWHAERDPVGLVLLETAGDSDMAGWAAARARPRVCRRGG
jgi:hypothetical protein